MSREIKFRAWDFVNKNMELNVHFLDSLNEILHKDKYDVMQFTGLKDISGKDIYEGDILAWRGNGNNSNNELSEVVFEDGSYLVKGLTWSAYWDLYDVCSSYEIIGNIYQNPELIK